MKISLVAPTRDWREGEEVERRNKKIGENRKKCREPTTDSSILWALLFHAAFGAVHELAHLCAAWMCGRLIGVNDDHYGDYFCVRNVVRALFGRHVQVAPRQPGGEEVKYS